MPEKPIGFLSPQFLLRPLAKDALALKIVAQKISHNLCAAISGM
jgi:hypothetical protein